MGISVSKALGFIWLVLACPHQADAAPQKVDEVRIQKKLKRLDLKRVNLSTELPEYHNYLGWKIDGRINDEVIHQSNVPLIDIDLGTFQMRDVGSIPIGTQVSLQKVLAFKGRHFFVVKRKDTNQILDGYVDGLFIVPTGDILSSPDQ